MADELRTVLGFDAAGAIATVQALTKALEGYSAAMSKAAGSTQTFNSASKSIDGLTKSTQHLDPVVKKTQDTYGKLASRLAATHPAMVKQREAVDKLVKSSNNMVLSWKSVIRIFAIQVIHQAISAITSSLKQATEESRKFIKNVSEIQTISGSAFGDLNKLADQVEVFSAATGQPLEAVTEGIYQALSNQVVDAAHSFEFLQAASDFSIAAVTDLGSSVELLSTIINSYNLNASDATEISGKLFKAIELGRFRGEEIAETFGRVTVLGAQLGVELDELLASMTTITRSGVRADEAFTLINNVMLKLIKPTKELNNVLGELGITSSEAGIQAYGLQGLLAKLGETSGDTASELADLFGRVRAIRGALSLGSEYAEKFASDLEAIKKAGAETTLKAKALVFETNAKQVDLELNRLHISLVNFGRSATTATKSVFDNFGGAVGTIKTLTTTTIAAGTAWLVVRKITDGTFASMVANLKLVHKQQGLVLGTMKSLIKSPVAWAIAIGAAVVAINWALNRVVSQAKKTRDALDAALAGKKDVELIKYKDELKKQVEFGKKYLSQVQRMLIERQKAFNDSAYRVKFTEEVLLSSLEGAVSNQASAMGSLFDGLIRKAQQLPITLREIDRTTAEIKTNIADWKFNRSIKGLNDIWKTYKLIDRAQSLRNQANQQAAKGEHELAKQTNDRAIAASQEALASADQTKNRTLVRKAEEDVERSMNNQVSLQGNLRKDTIDQATAINNAASGMKLLVAAIKPLEDEFKNITEQLRKTSDPIDRAKLTAKLKEVANEISKIQYKAQVYANLANKNEFQSEILAMQASFFDIVTGQVMTFDRAVDTTSKRIKDLKTEIDTTEQQKTAVELKKQLEEGAKALARQSELQGEITEKVGNAKNALLVYNAALDKAARFTTISAQGFKETPETIQKLKNETNSIVKSLSEMAQAGKANTTEFAAALSRLNQLKTLLSDANIPNALGYGTLDDVIPPLQSIFDYFKEISEEQEQVGEDAGSAEIGRKLLEEIQNSKDPIQTLMNIIKEAARNTRNELGPGTVSSMQQGTSAVQEGSKLEIAALQAVETQARRTRQAIAGATSGTETAAKGGMIYRAGGGFTPIGTDTIPAMLSPGEFVVNAKNTKRFFSQLVAMNSGRQPVYRETGGSVGDINISVNESSSPKTTAREIAMLIRREIQRGTIRKF